jgi:hypothetical protein
MHQSLQALGVSSAFEDKPPLNKNWIAYSGSEANVQDCLIDARQRLLAT